MFSYHSLPDLEKSIVSDSETEETYPQMRDYICFGNTKYIFYVLFLLMLILFLIFIIILITNYTFG